MAHHRHSTFILPRAAFCLLLGAATTVAVAWILAVAVPPTMGTSSRPSGIGDGWSYWVGRQFGTIRIMRSPAWFEMKGPLRQDYLAVRRREVPAWSAVHDSSHGERDLYLEEAQGWPALALRSETAISSPVDRNSRVRVRNGIATGIAQEGRWAGLLLPLRPIWSGFILDTVLFAAFAAVLLFGPVALRRAMRRRRGRCERCGYDLRARTDAAKCPECGASTQRPAG